MRIIQGDCLEILKTLPDNSVDSVVTDPPAAISFMSKDWDEDKGGRDCWIKWMQEIATECVRVLKPGGHALVWTFPRTSHWTATAWENAGFQIRNVVAHVFGQGFPKSLSIGKAINSLETKEWLKIRKGLDNLEKNLILELWKRNSKNVKIVGRQSQKNQIEVGINISKNDFVLLNVVENLHPKNNFADVIIAELNSIEVPPLPTGTMGLTVAKNVEVNTTPLQDNVKSVEKLSQNQSLKSMSIFTAQCNVKEWLNENTEVNHKVGEALKTLRGNKKYSNEEITNVLYVVLTDILKFTILNQSKTFQNLDTNQKTECASVINVIITEYTAENLISNTVAILKSKVVDKLQGNKREVLETKDVGHDITGGGYKDAKSERKIMDITKGTSEWEGWGTDLKPSREDWILMRNPLEKGLNIAENCLKWGVGGINIDGCRVPGVPHHNYGRTCSGGMFTGKSEKPMNTPEQGRFPANLILGADENGVHEEVRECFPDTKSGKMGPQHTRHTDGSPNGIYGKFDVNHELGETYGDSDNASRFFKSILYYPKASKSERNKGCEGLETSEKFTAGNYSQSPICKDCNLTLNGTNDHSRCSGEVYYKEMESKNTKNNHPTVKPVELMRYLCRLITPKGGLVLDPFGGSGTTGVGAVLEGFDFILIEQEEEFVKIAEARIAYWSGKGVVGLSDSVSKKPVNNVKPVKQDNLVQVKLTDLM